MNAAQICETLHKDALRLHNECERTEKLFEAAYVIETLTVRVTQIKILVEVILKILEAKS